MTEARETVAVVGVDFADTGDEALVMALRMLKRGSVQKLHLLHVLDPRDVIDTPHMAALETEQEVLAQAPGVLKKRAVELAESCDLRFSEQSVSAHTRIGAAAETLLQMTVDYDADLLIVGTHGRRGFAHMVLGSVAEELVRSAHCPVLIARDKDYTGLERTALPDKPLAPGQVSPFTLRHGTHEAIASTEASGWRPTDSGPTGFRIV
jgi:nucleotide-binding universal stress UspA family protein